MFKGMSTGGMVPTGSSLSDINISFHHLRCFILFSAHCEDAVYKARAAGVSAPNAAKEAFLCINLIKEKKKKPPLKISLNPSLSCALSLLQWFERQISGCARLASGVWARSDWTAAVWAQPVRKVLLLLVRGRFSSGVHTNTAWWMIITLLSEAAGRTCRRAFRSHLLMKVFFLWALWNVTGLVMSLFFTFSLFLCVYAYVIYTLTNLS